jgi:septum formation protein
MMIDAKFPKGTLWLASQSPRRQQLLRDLGLEFQVLKIEVEETFPDELRREEIPLYLSQLKAKAARILLEEGNVCITADTIVWNNQKVLNKPFDAIEAKQMLSELSGRMHEVVTAFTLVSHKESISEFVVTEVYFKQLSQEEIDFYVNQFKPFDKAGAYGIQEWIGYIGVQKIIGSYFNVVGLPVFELFQALQKIRF